VLFDDEGRGQADDVTVSGLGQESVVTETQAHFPGIVVWGKERGEKNMKLVFVYFVDLLNKLMLPLACKLVNGNAFYYNYLVHFISITPSSDQI